MEKKIDEVRLDEAVLSVREWSGKPYRTPQHDIFDLSSDYPVGYQKLIITEIGYKIGEVHYTKSELVDVLASNDGLFTEDFEDWFKDVKIGDELIIIHFTEFRYN